MILAIIPPLNPALVLIVALPCVAPAAAFLMHGRGAARPALCRRGAVTGAERRQPRPHGRLGH
jgi:hypothetical protein